MREPRSNISLAAHLSQRMLDHARSAPGEEVCGLLGARDGRLCSYYPVTNVAADRRRRFLLDARGQIDAMRRMREAGEELQGIFHSHPDSDAAPSRIDLQLAAYPDTIYFIASLVDNQPDLRAFHFDGAAFHPLELPEDA